MTVRTARAEWKGNLAQGGGTIDLGSAAFKGPYGFKSRFEDGPGTNPEELIAAAHAGCFSMAFAHMLSEGGHPPTAIRTSARVHLEREGAGFVIPLIELETEAEVPGLDEAAFQKTAADAKANCPLSKVLAGAEIRLKATLKR